MHLDGVYVSERFDGRVYVWVEGLAKHEVSFRLHRAVPYRRKCSCSPVYAIKLGSEREHTVKHKEYRKCG